MDYTLLTQSGVSVGLLSVVLFIYRLLVKKYKFSSKCSELGLDLQIQRIKSELEDKIKLELDEKLKSILNIKVEPNEDEDKKTSNDIV